MTQASETVITQRDTEEIPNSNTVARLHDRRTKALASPCRRNDLPSESHAVIALASKTVPGTHIPRDSRLYIRNR